MPVTASLIVGGIGAVTSGIKAYRAHKQLKELQKQPMPNYSVSPEMQHAYSRAEGMTNRGFTGAEEAAFKANLGQSSNTAYRQAIDQSGGGMSQAILGGINSRNLGALNQFAGQDAALHRQNIQYADTLAAQNQGQENLATGTDIQRRLMMEQGYGQAVSQNLNNAQSAINYGLTMGLGNSDLSGMFNKKSPEVMTSPGLIGQPPVPDMNMYSPSGQQIYNVLNGNGAPIVTQGINSIPFGLPQGMGPTGSQYSPYVNR